MTQDHDATPPPPEDFREYSDGRFGFSIHLPKRFESISTTFDPLARLIRGLDRLPEEERKTMQQSLPVGFWDPELIGESESGQDQPLRVIEYDVLNARGNPIPEEQAKQMWDEVVDFMPKTLKGANPPGYEYLETTETRLGPLPALAFDYRWDGPRPGHYGGDHVRIVWALSETTIFHLYYHCSGEEWEARLPEFEAVLASFAVLEPEEMKREAARSGAAADAFRAAQEAGDSEEAAMAAGQAAYDAAMAAEAAAGDDAPGDDAAPAGADAPGDEK